jgi:fermentation-respiration switch protein FrsA (DUF1100 family)
VKRRRLLVGASLLAAGGGWAAACASLYVRAFGARHWGVEAERGWTPDDLGVAHESLDVRTSDGVRLLAWYLPGSRDAAIIVSGGHRGRAGDVLGVSTALQRRGFHVLAYGWRGTPGSDPAPHTLGVHECRDLEAAIDALCARVGEIPVGLLGFSLGGAVSIVVGAGDPRVAAVCSDSAFSDPSSVLGDGIRRVFHLPSGVIVGPVATVLRRRTGAELASFRPLVAVAALAPRALLLIHGGSDASVHPVHAERLYAAAGEPKERWVLPGVPHVGAYFAGRREYVERVGGFFERHLSAAATRRADRVAVM